MKPRLILAVLILAGVGACSGNYTVDDSRSEEDPGGGESASELMTMSGINLRVYDSETTGGVAKNPLLWIQAGTYTPREEEVYDLVDARAVVYGAGAGDEISFEAKRVRFEEERRAHLREGVTARMGDMKMTLSDVIWEKTEEALQGVVYSDGPLSVDDNQIQLEASSLRFHPATRQFELTDVTGLVVFGGTET